ncbi:AAA family ATPase [Desulfogranum japonicum]|uniref:AAA family ATPase n=1 Tax=Desulfogranum japonicum TaxID=231447 RepID=UPI0004083D70|nr:MoxR family ATPase [Desulfogranum japonicum]
MTQSQEPLEVQIQQHIPIIAQVEKEICRHVVGQNRVVREMLIGVLASGHILVEGVPGLGKTLLARVMATILGAKFRRIQFTPDLMPGDITGHSLFDVQNNRFTIRKGPIFSHVVVADEINRAPAKTQAALLEAMQEQQVTIEGNTFALQQPFLVMATQNPIEQEGTYPLPQAQIDRFIFKIYIHYPEVEDEKDIVQLATFGVRGDGLQTEEAKPLLNSSTLLELQNCLSRMTIDQQVLDYIVRIVRATRKWNGIEYGAGPRGGINLLRAARGCALLNGRHFVTPDDVKEMSLPVLRHRVKLSADVEIEGYTPDQILIELLDSIETPRI